MNAWQLADIALAVATYASFFWGIKRFFVIPDEGLPRLMKLLQSLGLLVILLHLAFLIRPGQVQGAWAITGGGLFLAALGLFWRTYRIHSARRVAIAFSDVIPAHLVEGGPYRFVRHPFYSSYMLAWIAGTVATAQPWLLLSCVVLFFLYYLAARQEEALFAKSVLAENYRSYQDRTGMFVPRLVRKG